MTFLKKKIKQAVSGLVKVLGKTSAGTYFLEQVLATVMGSTRTVHHQRTNLHFVTPNALTRYRADSFSTKEPETLNWIEGIPRNSVIWDIGANVGLYSCYAAKARDCTVVAFEPSVFNLELLARNISLNGLTEKVVIVPLPLCDTNCLSTLNMTSLEWGGALSTFGKDYGWDGNELQKMFAFQTVGITMDGAFADLRIPLPSYIKLDVDGIEHLILGGGETVLRTVKGILIEVNDAFHEQADQCMNILTAAGFVLMEKRHSDMFDGVDSFGGGQIWNQIWGRQEI